MKKIWTIGHSTRTLREFINLLKLYNIQTLADVRSLPGSLRFPQFNKNRLAKSLAKKNIAYCQIPELGGLRKPNKNSKNIAWRNSSFRGYADYMGTMNFGSGIKQLTQLAKASHTAIMCAEAVWWRCHRSLISDYLKSKGWKVFHILNKSKPKLHTYTAPAKIRMGKLSYHS
jgi:uncharacterized protein (DUF488 family)